MRKEDLVLNGGEPELARKAAAGDARRPYRKPTLVGGG